jgi:hypothetical protein
MEYQPTPASKPPGLIARARSATGFDGYQQWATQGPLITREKITAISKHLLKQSYNFRGFQQDIDLLPDLFRRRQ